MTFTSRNCHDVPQAKTSVRHTGFYFLISLKEGKLKLSKRRFKNNFNFERMPINREQLLIVINCN